MTNVIEQPEHKPPPHHWTDRKTGEVFRWGGLSTCFCTVCHQAFTSVDAFERHFIADQTDEGGVECFDPATLKRQDRGPMFEKIEKPTWNPPHVWSRARPGVHPLKGGGSWDGELPDDTGEDAA